MAVQLKYKQRDIEELIDVVAYIDNAEDKSAAVAEKLDILTKYPPEDLKVFIDTLMMMENNGTEVTKENYLGVIGYILLRMNFLCA